MAERAVAITTVTSLVLAVSAGADTRIFGSISLPAGGATSICGGSGPKCTVVQQQVASASSGSYVLRAPADGTIVSWSYRSANAAIGNQYSLRVLRPANSAETSFTAVATSGAPPLPDGNDLVRGPFGVNIPVKAGDRIGLESQGPSDFGVPVFQTAQRDPSTGDGVVFFSPDVRDGSTATPTTTGGNDGSQVLVQATIEIASPPPPPPPPPPPAIGCPPNCPPSLGPALNGRIAFASEQSGHLEIYTMYPDGSHETRLTYDNALNAQPSYSPDGSKIVFDSDRPPNSGIYTMNADGSNERLLVRTDGSVSEHPFYSPDSSRIVYSTRGFMYMINADGTGQRQLGLGFAPAISPDGSTITFVRPVGAGDEEIALMNADGSNPRALFSHVAGRKVDFPVFSPDGSKIAFQMDTPATSYEIFTINSNGTGMRRLTFGPDGDQGPVFSPDGTKIAFFSYRPPPVEIYVMNLDGTNQQRITNDPGYHASPSWQALRATPGLISYRLSRLVFMAARTGPSAILTGRADNARDSTTVRLKRGTTVSVNLNEDATLRFGVQVPLAGRRGRGARCLKPTRSNHRHRSCTRYRTLKGGFNIKGHIGNNSFLFTGRLNRRTLKPGRYALEVAPHALHKTGTIHRVRFCIVASLPAPR
ncbi:MAG: TolB family protein [Solirubrobacteraceae bacterium]